MRKLFGIIKSKLNVFGQSSIQKSDLFKRMHIKLTLYYSGLMMLFLLVFILIVSSTLILVVTNEQEQQVQSLVNQEYDQLQKSFFNQNFSRGFLHSIDILDKYRVSFFYYLVTENNTFITGKELIPEERTNILKQLHNWVPDQNSIRYLTLRSAGYPTIHLIAAGRPIFQNGKMVAIFYTGKD